MLRTMLWAVEAVAVEWRAGDVDIPVVLNRRETIPLLYTLRAGCMGRRMVVRMVFPDPNPSVTAMKATMTVKLMLRSIFAEFLGLGIRRARGV
jgi:hypothetical protein